MTLATPPFRNFLMCHIWTVLGNSVLNLKFVALTIFEKLSD